MRRAGLRSVWGAVWGAVDVGEVIGSQAERWEKKELPALSLARPRQAGDLFLSLLSVSLSLSCSSFSPRKSGPSLRQVIVDLPPHTGELPPWLKLSLVRVSPLAVVAGRGLSWKRTAVELERSHYTQSCLLSFERH